MDSSTNQAPGAQANVLEDRAGIVEVEAVARRLPADALHRFGGGTVRVLSESLLRAAVERVVEERVKACLAARAEEHASRMRPAEGPVREEYRKRWDEFRARYEEKLRRIEELAKTSSTAR
jgi:hypothetical protein